MTRQLKFEQLEQRVTLSTSPLASPQLPSLSGLSLPESEGRVAAEQSGLVAGTTNSPQVLSLGTLNVTAGPFLLTDGSAVVGVHADEFGRPEQFRSPISPKGELTEIEHIPFTIPSEIDGVLVTHISPTGLAAGFGFDLFSGDFVTLIWSDPAEPPQIINNPEELIWPNIVGAAMYQDQALALLHDPFLDRFVLVGSDISLDISEITPVGIISAIDGTLVVYGSDPVNETPLLKLFPADSGQAKLVPVEPPASLGSTKGVVSSVSIYQEDGSLEICVEAEVGIERSVFYASAPDLTPIFFNTLPATAPIYGQNGIYFGNEQFFLASTFQQNLLSAPSGVTLAELTAGNLPEDADKLFLQSVSGHLSQAVFTVGFTDSSGRLNFTLLSYVNQTPLTNPDNRFDVNRDDHVIPSDVLLIINAINRGPGPGLMKLSPYKPPPPYLDVNGDGALTPQDVLVVINQINRPSQGASSFHSAAEAEAVLSLGPGKGDRSNLPERPEGCCAQIGPVPVLQVCSPQQFVSRGDLSACNAQAGVSQGTVQSPILRVFHELGHDTLRVLRCQRAAWPDAIRLDGGASRGDSLPTDARRESR